MNKAQMVDRLTELLGGTKAQSKRYYETIGDILEQEILEEGKANVFHFGQIKVRDRKERRGRNPKTGESLVIPQHKTLYLRVSDTMPESGRGGRVNLESLGTVISGSDARTVHKRMICAYRRQ